MQRAAACLALMRMPLLLSVLLLTAGAPKEAVQVVSSPPLVRVAAEPPVMVSNRTGQRLWFPSLMSALGGDAHQLMLRASTSADADNASDAVFVSRDLGASWRHVAEEPVQKRRCTPYPLELVGGSPDLFEGDFMGDVYIDDLVLLMIGEMLIPPEGLVGVATCRC